MARSAKKNDPMNILLLDIDGAIPEALLPTVETLAGNARLRTCRHPDALAVRLGAPLPDVLLLAGDDAGRLRDTFAGLRARHALPPAIAITADPDVSAVLALLRSGIRDCVVRDSAGHWPAALAECLAALEAAPHVPPAPRASTQTEQIIDGCSVALFAIDREHRVTHWNRACAQLTGIAAHAVLGTREQWRAFYPQARPCLADLLLDGARCEEMAALYGDKSLHIAGERGDTCEAEDFFPALGEKGRWLYFTAAILRDADGEIVGAVETLQDVSERELARRALHASEGLLRQIIQCSSVATFVIDECHEITHWNQACEILLGQSAETAIGCRTLAREIYREERPVLADLVLDGAAETEIARYYDGRYRRSPVADGLFEVEDYFPHLPGGPRWLHFAAAPLHDGQGRTIGAIETLIDISERKRAEALILESEQRLAQIVDGSPVATFVIDRQHRVTHWNRACSVLTGLPATAMLGRCEQWRAFYAGERPCMADLVLDGADEDAFARYYGTKHYHRSPVLEGGYEAQDFFPNFGSSGRWLYFTAAPLRDARGGIIGAIETLQDITEQKRAEQGLRESEERYRIQSITDGMTGLFNTRHFTQRLQEEMARCERYGHPLSLMVLDVDDFKRFNDSWGHVQGDEVLISLAECIRACLRCSDQAFRYGGEEFVVLLPETGLDEAEAAARRVCTLFAARAQRPQAGLTLHCTTSIGVTRCAPGESPRAFVARADSGTYEAKRQGKNRVVRVEPPVAT